MCVPHSNTGVIEPGDTSEFWRIWAPIKTLSLGVAGGTLQSVAAAKAGIMRACRPVVIGSQTEDDALQVLHEAAFLQGCPRFHEQAELHHRSYSQAGGRLRESIGIYVTNGEQEFEEGQCPHLLPRYVVSPFPM